MKFFNNLNLNTHAIITYLQVHLSNHHKLVMLSQKTFNEAETHNKVTIDMNLLLALEFQE